MVNTRTDDPVMARVKQLMREQRLQWIDVGRALNASPQRLYNWRKKGEIPPSAYPALAALLGCSLDYLVQGRSDDDRRMDLPPRASDWEKLPQIGRVLLGNIISLTLSGKLTEADLSFLGAMTKRLIHAPSKGVGVTNDDWLIGGPSAAERSTMKGTKNQ